MSWPHAERNYHAKQLERKPHRQHVPIWYCNPSTEESRYASGRYLAKLVNDCPECGADLNATRCNCIGN